MPCAAMRRSCGCCGWFRLSVVVRSRGGWVAAIATWRRSAASCQATPRRRQPSRVGARRVRSPGLTAPSRSATRRLPAPSPCPPPRTCPSWPGTPRACPPPSSTTCTCSPPSPTPHRTTRPPSRQRLDQSNASQRPPLCMAAPLAGAPEIQVEPHGPPARHQHQKPRSAGRQHHQSTARTSGCSNMDSPPATPSGTCSARRRSCSVGWTRCRSARRSPPANGSRVNGARPGAGRDSSGKHLSRSPKQPGGRRRRWSGVEAGQGRRRLLDAGAGAENVQVPFCPRAEREVQALAYQLPRVLDTRKAVPEYRRRGLL